MKRLLFVAVIAIIAIVAVYIATRSRDAGKRFPSAPSNNLDAGEVATTRPSSYKGGDYSESLMVGGRERTYLMHVPSGYDPQKQYSLVLSFHGSGGTGKQMVRKTGFNGYADRDGFIAVYPDGIDNSWNDGRGTTEAEKQGIDDVAFVSALIDRLGSALSIDKSRVYATGMSNGAIFSHRLACELSSTIAAIGPVAGEIPEAIASSCKMSHPSSRIVIHGVEDPLTPFFGGATRRGRGGKTLSAEATAEKWAAHNGCSLAPVKTKISVKVDDGTSVEHWVYPNCKNGAAVEVYAVNGMGHAWPPQEPEFSSLSGNTSHNIDASASIWDFFKTHPRQKSKKPSKKPSSSRKCRISSGCEEGRRRRI